MFLQFLINKSEKASDGEGLVKDVRVCGFGYDQLFHKHQLNIWGSFTNMTEDM